MLRSVGDQKTVSLYICSERERERWSAWGIYAIS